MNICHSEFVLLNSKPNLGL